MPPPVTKLLPLSHPKMAPLKKGQQKNVTIYCAKQKQKNLQILSSGSVSASAPFSPSYKINFLSETGPNPFKNFPLNRFPLPLSHYHLLLSLPFLPNLILQHHRRVKEAHLRIQKKKRRKLNCITALTRASVGLLRTKRKEQNNLSVGLSHLIHLLAVQKFADKDFDEKRNFPDGKRVLIVIRTGSGSRQTWTMT